MRKVFVALWRFLWPDFGVLYGLGLQIDNWGHNHPVLIMPAVVLFMVALDSFVRKIVQGVRP